MLKYKTIIIRDIITIGQWFERACQYFPFPLFICQSIIRVLVEKGEMTGP